MQTHRETFTLHHDAHLHLESLHANFKTHSFPKHMHDYFVIGFIRQGVQRFWYRGETHVTPGNGLFFLNPGEAHTGKAATEKGFEYHAFYPTLKHMQGLLEELGKPKGLPYFKEPRVDDSSLSQKVEALQHYSDTRLPETEKREPKAVEEAKAFLEDNYNQNFSLQVLSEVVGLSRYYFLRVFKKTVGLPPHAYLESLRIHHAQHLIKQGEPLAQIAYMTGFSHRSHFTNRFKHHIGVTPGEYAKKSNILQDNPQVNR
jgi:AraC-like DNA-binding protein